MTSVAFDPWRCDEKNYRFGSVGEDRRLCLWDFSVGMLHRPRGGGGGNAARGSITSRFTGGTALARAETAGTSRSGYTEDTGSGRSFTGPHPVEPRASTAMLPPVLKKVVDADPLAWLDFTEEAIMTSCKSGKSSYSFDLLSPVDRLFPTSSPSFPWAPRLLRLLRLMCDFPFKGHIRTWNRPSDPAAQAGETSAA